MTRQGLSPYFVTIIMKTALSIVLVVALLSIVVCSCESKKNSDGGKVPLDVKEAEAKDPTRLDSARTDVEPTWGKGKAVGDSSS